MKKLLLLTFFTITILVGNGDVFGQDSEVTRDCLECKNKSQANRLIISNFNLTDEDGNLLNVDNCSGATDIYLSFEYFAQNDLQGVFIVSNLNLINNTSGDTTTFPFDFLVGNLQRSTGNNNASRSVRIKITLPSEFNCQSQSLQLADITAHWLPNSNQGSLCERYNNGQCLEFVDPRNVTVDGFIYTFDYVVGCFEEDGSTFLTYFITSLAGGNGVYEIDWTININGGTAQQVSNQFIVPISLTSPNDEVIVSLFVQDSSGFTLTPAPAPQTAEIGTPFPSPTYTINNNIEDTEPAPNGSIKVDIPEEDIVKYIIIWSDEDGNVFNPEDVTNLTDLDKGGYILTMIDEETGLCRRFDFVLASILPVELLDPSARYENTNKLSRISWATAKENANSHFEIERSDKGINDFKKVGEIDGMGWKDTVTEYEFIDDKLPLSGGNILYRIKQVDFDGNFTYSKVLSVRAEGVQATQGVWRAFPNPTMGDLLRISLLDRTQYDEEQITFRIVHPNLITQGITVNTEDEMNDQLAQLIPRAPKGVLVVEIQWGQKVEHIKVLKK